MDDDLTEAPSTNGNEGEANGQNNRAAEEIAKLQTEFQSRLIAANLRTEAVRAGMIDLDGLKLVDLSAVRLDNDDKVIGGRKMMADLRREKPWLFGVASSSSAATAPASQPVRQKTAMDMTDEEYAAARTAVTRFQF